MSIDERIKYLEMKERHKGKLRPWYKKWWGVTLIIIAIIVLAAAVAAGIYIVKEVKNIRNGNNAAFQEAEIKKITAAIDGRDENYHLGSAEAKVKIVVFSDYACPYCQQSAPVVRDLAKKYGNKIQITVRDYPLHSNSVALALAGNCAGAQGKFWEMYDSLFTQQDKLSALQGDALTAQLEKLATGLKIDTEKFNSCLTDKTYLYRLNDDFSDAELLGLSGTPTWFVNRYKITGFYPEENFVTMIDGLLAEYNNPAK